MVPFEVTSTDIEMHIDNEACNNCNEKYYFRVSVISFNSLNGYKLLR